MRNIYENQIEEKKAETKLLSLEQITTRGDGKMEKGEDFLRNDIDFGKALEHLKIHHGGEIAGSVFNAETIKNSDDVKKFLVDLLPEGLNYDQYGRAEITLEVGGLEKPLGFSGVSSIEDIQKKFPGAQIKNEMRMPGGAAASEDGINGAWYPEMARNASGGFAPVLDAEGNINNPKGKFEPEANIAYVPKNIMETAMATNKMTIIIEKDKDKGNPAVLTIFPGENTPPFPAKINTENYKADTLKTQNAEFWNNYAFIKQSPEIQPSVSLEELAEKDATTAENELARVREELKGPSAEKPLDQAGAITDKISAWYKDNFSYATADGLANALQESIIEAIKTSRKELNPAEEEEIENLINLEVAYAEDAKSRIGHIDIAGIKIPCKESIGGDYESGEDTEAVLTPDPRESKAEFNEVIKQALGAIEKHLDDLKK